MDTFDLLGYRYRRTGKGIQETDKTLRKGEAGDGMFTSIARRVCL